jgi:hypothetical protein
MSTVYELFRSASGYASPYFIVDTDGNLITQTITVTGSRIELTPGSYIGHNGNLLLSQTTLGESVTHIAGTLDGLNVNGIVNITGNLNLTLNNFSLSPTTTGTLDNVSIGVTTAAAGRFSTLSVTTSAVISPTGNVAISPTGSVTISPTGTLIVGTSGTTTSIIGNISATTANQTITISPTGTGSLTIAPTQTGAMNNVAIGATTASTGRFTSATATTPDERWNSNTSQLATKRYVENSIMFAYFTGR